MGGHFYVRAHGDALFELAQPAKEIGIGVDALPRDVRESAILTGSDLGRLGARLALPDETAVNEYKLTELADLFVPLHGRSEELRAALHLRAQHLLHADKVDEALMTVLAFNDR
jgi:hypothetical protein